MMKEDLLIRQVQICRRQQPRLGGRKLLVVIQPFMQQHGICLGRDAFFSLLNAYGLLVRKRRRSIPRTTFSNHHYRRYDDLTRGLLVQRAQQLWVSDITYIHLKNSHAYLSLITDAYSRKIVGFALSPDLTTEGCLKALRAALEQREAGLPLIHHSDRGSQYCSGLYTDLLTKNDIAISMTQSGDPRDNAIAERVNGILKSELLDRVYISYEQAATAVQTAIETYNTLRPHSSVDMLTPQQAHLHQGELRRRWKSYYKTANSAAVPAG